MFELKEYRTANLIWKSFPMPRTWEEFQVGVRKLWLPEDRSGLYAFEGKHNSHLFGTVLYIGKTQAQGIERMLQSAKASFYCGEMYSCYWDMTVRWTIIPDATHLAPLETILISAMLPPLNNQGVNRWLPEECWNLLVTNAGDKGLLCPIIHGDYFYHKSTGPTNQIQDMPG